MRPKVSVIIPIHGAGFYIERCAKSLFNQTLDSLEYIFIDDESPDNSIEILLNVLSEYPQRKSQVRLIRHSRNVGVGQSRREGIGVSSGQYLIHCDPDDWIDTDYYEGLYDVAIKVNADISIGNYIEETESKRIIHNIHFNYNKKELFHAIAFETLHTSLCNKLIKCELAKRYIIHEGIDRWEDMSIVAPMLMDAETIGFSENGYYHYTKHDRTKIGPAKDFVKTTALSQIKAVANVERSLNENGYLKVIDPLDMLRLKWAAKKILMVYPTKEHCALWRRTFPECNIKLSHLHLGLKNGLYSYLIYLKLGFIQRFIIGVLKHRLKTIEFCRR